MKKIFLLLILAATMCSCRDAASSKRKLQHRLIDDIALTNERARTNGYRPVSPTKFVITQFIHLTTFIVY